MLSRLCVFGIVLTAISTSGCVGWGPNGCEQFRGPFRGMVEGLCSSCGEDCCNCDGYNPPFGNIRRTLACGSGCGEIYYGDWVSNPPNSCNECDARGYAYGINSRFPWLCNYWRWWWRPLGVQYRPNGGYGNPYRCAHPGLGDYGYRTWPLLGDPCGCGGGCESGCSPGCAKGDCAPNAPAGPNLKPIPNNATSARATGSVRVNYESPLIRSSRMRKAIANRRAATHLNSPGNNAGANAMTQATIRTATPASATSSTAGATTSGGRLKKQGSLR